MRVFWVLVWVAWAILGLFAVFGWVFALRLTGRGLVWRGLVCGLVALGAATGRAASLLFGLITASGSLVTLVVLAALEATLEVTGATELLLQTKALDSMASTVVFTLVWARAGSRFIKVPVTNAKATDDNDRGDSKPDRDFDKVFDKYLVMLSEGIGNPRH